MPCGEGTSLSLSELCVPASALFVVTNQQPIALLTSPTPSLCLTTSSCGPVLPANAPRPEPFLLSVFTAACCVESLEGWVGLDG